MTSMSKAVLLASAASLTAGLQVTTQADEIIGAAIDKLEGMWPQKGKQILEDIFGTLPPRDEGRALRERLLQKFQKHGTFVFAAFGSSVSAGHDNFMNQSWPFELERMLKPTFKELGFDFEMRQRSAGGFGEMPFGAGCLASRAGEGVDALSWEWHYFQDPPCEGHHFLEEAAAMRSSPMVFALADSNIPFDTLLKNWHGETGCGDIRRDARDAAMARKDEETWHPDKREYKPNEWYLTEEFISNAEVDRFSRELKSRKCHGLEEHPDERVPARDIWLQQTGVAPAFERAGHAFYPVAVGAGTAQLVSIPWYQAREKAFKYNWHPGPLGHTLIASSMAHYILTNLRSVLGEGPVPKRMKGPSADNPLVGKPIVGQLEEPQCGALKVNQCKTGMFPTSSGTALEGARHADQSDDTWEYGISRQAAERGHEAVDKRYVYRGNKTSGELKLSFQADSDGQYVLLCGAPCSWWCNGNAGFVSSKSQRWWPKDGPERKNVSDLTFSIDGRDISGGELTRLHDEMFHQETGKFCPGCKNPMDLCQPVAKVAKGRHTVGARVEPRTRAAIAPADVPHMQEGEEMFVEILEMLVVG